MLRKNQPAWEYLDKDSPAVVLTWHGLNRAGNDTVDRYDVIRQAIDQGLRDRVFYNQIPRAGHEYDAYDLNEIQTFWDRFCK